MRIKWAGLAPGLLLRLERGHGEGLGFQLQRELREAIRSSRLAPDERLPSSRAMARELGVSRGLVQECYAQLQAEGYLTTQVGSATRVSAGPHAAPLPTARATPATPLLVDFRPGVPDLASFPKYDWLWAFGRASREAPTAALDYGDPRGSAALREVLAGYLRRVRGAVADPERMVISTGYTQGLNLVLASLAGAGLREVAFEDPGDRDQRAIARRAGMTAVPVPVDERGIDVQALSRTGVRAVVLTPGHQSPTGVALAPERRHALAAWAHERGATILEDDYDAEFRYDRPPVGALQGLAPDRVVALSSVSKTLAPALRLGWILCPEALAPGIAREKQLADLGSPGLDQLALARLIESGRYDKHLRRLRMVYAQRRQALREALARHAPKVGLRGLSAGFHAVALLPDGADEKAVIAAAGARSIGLYGMSAYRSTGATRPPQLVLGFGNLSESAIERGIGAIADLLCGEAKP